MKKGWIKSVKDKNERHVHTVAVDYKWIAEKVEALRELEVRGCTTVTPAYTDGIPLLISLLRKDLKVVCRRDGENLVVCWTLPASPT